MVSRLACKLCREEIATIRNFVEDQGLNFSKNSNIYQEYIDVYLHDAPNLTPDLTPDDSDLYNKHIEQEIKRVHIQLSLE